MRYFLILLAILVGGGTAWAGNSLLPGIKGDDDRRPVPSTQYPWSAIGRVNSAAGGHCTGTLIGPRTVLTAAHCLWNKRTQRFLAPESVHFVAGWDKGDYLAHAKAASFHLPEAYRPGLHQVANGQHDWAVITLTEDLGKAVGQMGVARLDAKGLAELKGRGVRFVQAGYAQDKAQVLMAHIGCRLDGFVKGAALIAHGCDAVPGDSGSPIFVEDKDGIRIVAIHVATARKGAPESVGLAVPSSVFAEKTGTPAPVKPGNR